MQETASVRGRAGALTAANLASLESDHGIHGRSDAPLGDLLHRFLEDVGRTDGAAYVALRPYSQASHRTKPEGAASVLSGSVSYMVG